MVSCSHHDLCSPGLSREKAIFGHKHPENLNPCLTCSRAVRHISCRFCIAFTIIFLQIIRYGASYQIWNRLQNLEVNLPGYSITKKICSSLLTHSSFHFVVSILIKASTEFLVQFLFFSFEEMPDDTLNCHTRW